MQENTLLKDTAKEGIVLQPDYDFDRNPYHSYKRATTTLDVINSVRRKCKLIEKKKKFTVIQNMKNKALKILLGASLDMQLPAGTLR